MRDESPFVFSGPFKDVIPAYIQHKHAIGYKNIYTGEDDKRSFQSDFIPYIFSKEEIDRMFQAMKRKCQEYPTYLNHY